MIMMIFVLFMLVIFTPLVFSAPRFFPGAPHRLCFQIWGMYISFLEGAHNVFRFVCSGVFSGGPLSALLST